MSGAEVPAVLGVISSIISIVEGTKKVYDAATNAKGLPEAFREVAGRLPIVENILSSTYQYIEKREVNNDACKGVEQVAKACEENAKKLKELFHKTISGDDASRLTRYIKAVKVVGKGGKVETLMKGMLVDVQLLAFERGINAADNAQQERIIEAIAEVSAISPSVPEHEFHEAGSTYTHTGPGPQNNVQGIQNNLHDTARQINNSNIGDVHIGKD